MKNRKNKRKVTDRRGHNLKQDQAFSCNRRFRPCRRLNSITAEWVPMETITRHPVIWNIFRRLGYAHRL